MDYYQYVALMPSYASAAGLWFVINRINRKTWSQESPIFFQKPWLEFLYALLAVVFILVIGQLYLKGMLIPNKDKNYIDALNQILIFSPTFILIVLRKQSTKTIWLPASDISLRIIFGLILAFTSLLIYWLIRKDADSLVSIISNTYHPKNISFFVQVFMEDITIALVFVRLSEWIGRKWTIGVVAILFAAGHIPSLLSNRAIPSELIMLLMDTAIGIIILSAVSKSKDVWWFFMVHFALDMTQYYGGN